MLYLNNENASFPIKLIYFFYYIPNTPKREEKASDRRHSFLSVPGIPVDEERWNAMRIVLCALALLSGVIGAGFASGREIAHFFAAHGSAAPIAAACACLALFALFFRLPAQLEQAGAPSLQSLCALRFGSRFGNLCSGLFFLLLSVTGGAMLAACAELAALTLPLRHAFGLGMIASILLGGFLAARSISGLALPGAALALLLPALLLRLLRLPAGEACFSPAEGPIRAAASGLTYGALNAAQLAGALPMLLSLKGRERRRAVLLFTLLFGALLALGTAVLHRHRQIIFAQPLPLVYLSRALGKPGFYLCALCLYAAALSTLCAMLTGLMHMLPGSALVPSLCCVLFARLGFGKLVARGYPVLGALCAALLLLLCLPLPSAEGTAQKASSSSR